MTSPDKGKVVLVEIKAGVEVSGWEWQETGAGSYWTHLSPSKYGEIVEVREDGSTYQKVDSVSTCDSTASSFFYDYYTEKLYVHPSSGSPEDHTLIAYFWVCFTNIQQEDYRVVFTPPGATHPVYYLPFLISLPSLSQGVGDYHVGNITLSFGRLSFANPDGWWYSRLEEWLIQNADARVLIGEKGASYEDYIVIFRGLVRNPRVNDEQASLETKDIRLQFRKLPIYKFWKSNYPNLDEQAEGQPIPLPFGELKNVTPICIDAEEHKYKVSSHPIESIDAVYLDGEPVDFTADPSAGEFTISEDPAGRHVTCDIKGIKCDYSTGEYSENVADILYYILKLNNIPDEQIDLSSFNSLKTARTQKLSLYIDTETPTLEVIRLLEASCVFHLIPSAEGKYEVKYYQYGDEDAINIPQEFIHRLVVSYDTERIYKKVVIKYGKDPTTGTWKRVEATEEKVSWRHKEEDTLIVETALRDSAEAQSLANFYLRLIKRSGKFIEGEFIDYLQLQPTGKIKLSKRIKTGTTDLTVLEEEVYRILSVSVNLNRNTVRVLALRDIEATGAEHTDIPHADSHTDTPHEDVPHGDTEHTDSYQDSHTDTAHQDVPHQDTPHEDIHMDDYQDVPEPHVDKHYDSYQDTAHQDTPHEDSHGDSYNDSHGDAQHSDQAHEDTPHEDSHEDTPHTDSQY